ncbi:IS66 family transposase, partial [Aeromonas caviae]|uniref:IS66 family transposase n=1 Tax=Aeromonas caviae TaxID=648 RepID=UPI002E16B7C9
MWRRPWTPIFWVRAMLRLAQKGGCPRFAHFMTAYGRGQEAAKRLLGAEFDGVLVTDQYAGYRFIDADQRQL